MDQVKLPKSVEAFREDCEAILSWLDDGPLTEREFDKRSFKWRTDPDRPRVARAWGEGTIMPPMWGDPMIAYTQEMMREGMIEAEEVDGKIVYRRATESV